MTRKSTVLDAETSKYVCNKKFIVVSHLFKSKSSDEKGQSTKTLELICGVVNIIIDFIAS